MNDAVALVTTNSLYDKPVDVDSSIDVPDGNIFLQLQNHLSGLSTRDDDSLSSNIDYLPRVLLFLLEHLPLEIDLQALLVTQPDYHATAETRIYRPNIASCSQKQPRSPTEAQRVLDELYRYLRVKKLESLLRLRPHTTPVYLQCLHLLTPLLLKTNYHKYPVALKVFARIVRSMDSSALSESLDWLFPVCLITLDDPSADMKYISLSLLDHLQRHCTSTDLSLFNRSNVVM